MGPESYTSILPNLLVQGIRSLEYLVPLLRYIVNVMTQPVRQMAYSAADHVQAVIEHSGRQIIEWALVNNERPMGNTLVRYRKKELSRYRLTGKSCRDLAYVFKSTALSANDTARHDPG